MYSNSHIVLIIFSDDMDNHSLENIDDDHRSMDDVDFRDHHIDDDDDHHDHDHDPYESSSWSSSNSTFPYGNPGESYEWGC